MQKWHGQEGAARRLTQPLKVSSHRIPLPCLIAARQIRLLVRWHRHVLLPNGNAACSIFAIPRRKLRRAGCLCSRAICPGQAARGTRSCLKQALSQKRLRRLVRLLLLLASALSRSRPSSMRCLMMRSLPPPPPRPASPAFFSQRRLLGLLAFSRSPQSTCLDPTPACSAT